ncbi:hypothetical protein JKP88DRAFT_281665 [Tribonema minus]|uniref:MYND-type domain-containing protein n=1 Tax=Tribonema minus TaxID=303371 RepID=A0A835YNP1_9STRA|nr:hypothetical protein JKP88DRAFT_281665 [Tribonema minus]
MASLSRIKFERSASLPRGDVHSTCKGAYYCSRECQLADWKDHKAVCKQWSLSIQNKGPDGAADYRRFTDAVRTERIRMASEAMKLDSPGLLVETHTFMFDIQHVPTERTFRVERTHLLSLEARNSGVRECSLRALACSRSRRLALRVAPAALRAHGIVFPPPAEGMLAAHDIVRLVYAARMEDGATHIHTAPQYVEKSVTYIKVSGADSLD